MLPETGLYHTCFTVPDLEAAKVDLGKAFALTWTDSLDAKIEVKGADGHQESVALRFCYSLQGPPYIELIQGPAGHRFFGTQGTGHIHHVGLFVDDLHAAIEDYEGQGLALRFSLVDDEGERTGLSYHENPFGANIELVSQGTRRGVQAMIRADGGDA